MPDEEVVTLVVILAPCVWNEMEVFETNQENIYTKLAHLEVERSSSGK